MVKNQKNTIKIFEDRKIRSVWDTKVEKWYISIVDIVGVLTESSNPNNYWKVLKSRLKKEGNESVTNCNQLKLPKSLSKEDLSLLLPDKSWSWSRGKR